MKAHRSLPSQLATSTGEMVLVPAGEFQYGESRERVSLAAFYVDKTEVSNGAYSLFCKATGCTPPAADPSLPVVNVNLDQAERFASWAGKRLPTDREWEKAARGTDGRQFPWGNTSDASKANVQSAGPVAVNSYAQGASPYGALQFAGNVWELVNSPHVPTPETLAIFAKVSPPATANEAWIAIRGGSFRGGIEKAMTWQWAALPARWSSSSIGFRCVKDPPR
jgi:eukaryotic-like serine/threonine-protein kinase